MKTLINVYFAIFDSHLTYSSNVWAENINNINDNITLENKCFVNNTDASLHKCLKKGALKIGDFNKVALVSHVYRHLT